MTYIVIIFVFIIICFILITSASNEHLTDSDAIQNLASIYNSNKLVVTNANVTGSLTTGSLTAGNLTAGSLSSSNIQVPAGKYSYSFLGGDSAGTSGVSANGIDLYRYTPSGYSGWIYKVDQNGVVTIGNALRIGNWTISPEGTSLKFQMDGGSAVRMTGIGGGNVCGDSIGCSR